MTLSSQSRAWRAASEGERSQLGGVRFAHVLDVAEPVVDQAEPFVTQRRQHAAAAVVPADDDVPYVQHVDRVLRCRTGS